eukprot:7602791-Lingulodinium_polyedra.AAC.1
MARRAPSAVCRWRRRRRTRWIRLDCGSPRRCAGGRTRLNRPRRTAGAARPFQRRCVYPPPG